MLLDIYRLRLWFMSVIRRPPAMLTYTADGLLALRHYKRPVRAVRKAILDFTCGGRAPVQPENQLIE